MRATQYSADAPSRYQSLSPYTRSPTPASLTPAPRAAISPENSCPGMTGNGRGSPARLVQVGSQESSVRMTPGRVNPYEHLAFPGTGLLSLVVGERLGAIAGAQTNRLHAPLPNKHLSAELRVFGP